MHTLLEALKNSILITGLVMIMMILIEYINIHSHGESFRKLRNSSVKQVFLAAALGLVPGCVGGFAVVSLYTHKLLSFGALVAMMIASSGDEAFIVMAMIPKTALLLFALLFVIGILAGLVTDKFVKKQVAPFNPEHYEIHQDCCDTYKHSKTNIFNHSFKTGLTKMTKERAFILAGIALFISAVIFGILEHDHSAHVHEAESTVQTGQAYSLQTLAEDDSRVCIQDQDHEHDHEHETTIGNEHTHDTLHNHAQFDIFSERWMNLLFAGLSIIVLFMTAKASEHFIKEHLWNHVVKKHLKPIFLWTFGALLVIHYGIQFLHLEEWVAGNIYLVILLAVLIGLIPESGPHMVFISLFAAGIVPFSVLLASSIVQDGHTALPLLAESKKSFAKAKLINMIIGLSVGILLHLAGL
ncbi:MAG: hypothetical protein EOM16_01655 [Bacteroidia bacterium]|nr:hypothetical protein [Bacteroidia bacterium]